MEFELNFENDPRDYVGYNLAGAPFNKKFPPNDKENGSRYDGYATKAEGVLFYDFAVMGYDVEFTYNEKKYYLLNTGEAHLSDSTYSERYETFDSPMSLIENLIIEGKPLIRIIGDISEIEPI
jgi:hypothetical protein